MQRRRNYAPFICKWAGRSLGLTSHQGFLNRSSCCDQSGTSSLSTFYWDKDWPDEIHRLWRKKKVYSPFWDNSDGFGLYICFSVLWLSECILFCLGSIRSVVCVACPKVDCRAVTYANSHIRLAVRHIKTCIPCTEKNWNCISLLVLRPE